MHMLVLNTINSAIKYDGAVIIIKSILVLSFWFQFSWLLSQSISSASVRPTVQSERLLQQWVSDDASWFQFIHCVFQLIFNTNLWLWRVNNILIFDTESGTAINWGSSFPVRTESVTTTYTGRVSLSHSCKVVLDIRLIMYNTSLYAFF